MLRKNNKRSIQAAETKNRILEAAKSLFTEYGIENVSVADIAEKSGCSPGNIYHYFNSKEDLALQSIHFLDEKYMYFYENTMREEPYRSMSAAEQMVEFFCFSARICSEEGLLRVSYIYSLKNLENNFLNVTGKRGFYRIAYELSEKMHAEGSLSKEISDEEAVAYFTIMLRGILVNWLINSEKDDVLSESRTLITKFLNL